MKREGEGELFNFFTCSFVGGSHATGIATESSAAKPQERTIGDSRSELKLSYVLPIMQMCM